MIKASAPRESGGYSWVLLSIALVGSCPLVLNAQDPKTEKPAAGAPAAAKNADPAAAAKPEAAPPAAEAEAEAPAPQVEIFRDPRVEKLLENNFPQSGKPAPRAVIAQVKAAAAQAGNANRDVMMQYVDNWIAELTNKNNIRAVIDQNAGIAAGAGAQFAIHQATGSLVEPILTARALNNAEFLSTYNKVILQKLPPLLEGHLLTRIEASIVLSQTGSPEAVDIFLKQLANPEQTVWVNLWAARGLTNIQNLTRYSLGAPDAIRSGKALAEFLTREHELPWPVRYRALEALGSMRQASTPRPPNNQPEMATTAVQFLTDPEGRLEVRAEAGWALGMLQVNAGFAGYNYALIAHNAGEVAVSLGTLIHDVFPKNPTQAEAYTAILMSQVLQTFSGIPDARDSGLLNATHPSANQARPLIKQVSDLIRPIVAASVKLVKGAPGQAPQFLQELDAKLSALKAWLQKNPPATTSLVPGGPQFPIKGAQIVNEPGGRAQVANGPAGRGR